MGPRSRATEMFGTVDAYQPSLNIIYNDLFERPADSRDCLREANAGCDKSVNRLHPLPLPNPARACARPPRSLRRLTSRAHGLLAGRGRSARAASSACAQGRSGPCLAVR